jgi:hypothetical protein
MFISRVKITGRSIAATPDGDPGNGETYSHKGGQGSHKGCPYYVKDR